MTSTALHIQNRSASPVYHRLPVVPRQTVPVNPGTVQVVEDRAQIVGAPVFLKTGEQTVRLPLDGTPALLGRSDESPLKFQNDLVSRRHAEVRARNGTLEVRDLTSTNGTWIAGQRIKDGQWYPVANDQDLKLASISLTWGNDHKIAETGQSSEHQLAQVAGAVVGGPVGIGLTLAGLKSFASKKELESKSTLLHSLGSAGQMMSKDSGIVELPKGVPTMVIPDIHAQRDYLTRALEYKIDGKPVLDLLKEGKMNLLCLGDGMHGEGRAKGRWMQAEQDFLHGQPSRAMYDEMVESMGTMKMVMDLKSGLGDNFAYLRGNHDDIDPKNGYMKFTRVGESNLVKDWVSKNYGGDFVEQWHQFEQSMPLVAKGSGFVASHAAPGKPLNRNDVESKSEEAFFALAWTENRNWAEHGQEQNQFEANLKVVGAEAGDRWFVGHRKVEDANYRTQFDEQLVQVNPLDTDGFVVAMIGADGSYDPEKDTFKV